MLSSILIISVASSLLVTLLAVPIEHLSIKRVPNDVSVSRLPPRTLPTTLLTNNLTTIPKWRPFCWPDDGDPVRRACPITDRADCPQAVMSMLYEGPDDEQLVWEETRVWIYGSCGVILIPSPVLPIHRGTFSRTDIARCAEIVRMACVTEEHGYRGGAIPIGAGVFEVAVHGKPIHPSIAGGLGGCLSTMSVDASGEPIYE